MKDKRPENLDIKTIHFPPAAISSILHRISGALLFPGVALLLWLLDRSLNSREDFNTLKDTFGTPLFKLLLWAVLAALAYHLLAGVRHMIMDLGYLEGRESGQRTALATIVSGVLLALAIGIGVWIW